MILNEEAYLTHFGVKGMRWGHRKGPTEASGSSKKAARRLAKADKKWSQDTLKKYVDIYNGGAEIANARIASINNKPRYKGADFTKDSPLRQAYYTEHARSMERALNESARSVLGSGINSPSGKLRVEMRMSQAGGFPNMVVVDSTFKHSVQDGEVMINVKYSDDGHILSMTLDDGELLQSTIDDDEFLIHFGVKGMKWGQRKAAFQRNRQLNKKSYKKDVAARDKQIQDARDRIASGQNREQFRKAKEQYKVDKKKLGSREARKKYNKRTEKLWEDEYYAQSAKSGKETTVAILAVAGAFAISAIAGASSAKRGY